MTEPAKTIELLVLVRPEQVVNVWPDIVGFLEEANERSGGKWRVHDWLIKCATGMADLFVPIDKGAVLVGETMTFPNCAVYTIVYAGGGPGKNWTAYDKQIEAIARQRGCAMIENIARPGWRNIAKEAGYELTQCVWRKRL